MRRVQSVERLCSLLVSLCLIAPVILSANVTADSMGAPERPPEDPEDSLGGFGLLGGGGGDSSPPPLPETLPPLEPEYPTIYDVNMTDDEAIIPSPLDVNDTTFTPPYADLIVSYIKPTTSQVQNGSSVELEAGIDNQGFEYLNASVVTFYVDRANESNLLLKTKVSLESWSGVASCTWNPNSTGNHIILVIVDEDNATWELDEGNNMRDRIYEVVIPNVPEGPDLVAHPEGITSDEIATTDNSTTVEIEVENEGDTVAYSIGVVVKEMPTENLVDEYQIASLGASSSHKKQITWNASVPGRLYLDVYVDANKTVDESDEDNNIARNGFFVVNGTLNETYYDPPENTTGQNCENDTIIILGSLVVPSGITLSYYYCQIIVIGNAYVNGTLELYYSSLVFFGSVSRTINVQGHIYTMESTVTQYMWSLGYFFEVHGSIDMTDSNVFWTTGQDGIDNPSGLQLYTSNASFDEVTFSEGIHNGLWIAGNVSLDVLTNSTLESNGGAGITVSPNASLVLNDATVDSNREGVRFNKSNGSVTNSSIIQNCGCGIKILEAIGTMTIRDNSDISANGIKMCPERSGNFTIHVPIPVMGKMKVAGIYMRNSTAQIENNTIVDNWFGIQLVHQTNSSISENTIQLSDGAGILASAKSYSSTPEIKSNNISYNKAGVISEASDAVISEVDFVSNKIGVQGKLPGFLSLNDSLFMNNLYAVNLRNSSIYAYFSGNTLGRNSLSSYPENYGIWMEDANPLILNNSFINLYLSAADMFCNSCGSTMTENRFDGGTVNHRFGVRIEQSSTVILNGNNFTGYIAYPYDVRAVLAYDAVSVVIENNTFYHNVYSVFLTNTSGNVTDNIFRAGEYQPVETYPPTGGSSIYVKYSKDLNITHNVMNYSGYSIYLIRSSPLIERNEINNLFYYPGYLYKDYDPGPGVRWDQIDRCAMCVYDGSSPFIGNNTITGNSYGISVEAGVGVPSSPTIFNNTVSETGYLAIGCGGRAGLPDINGPQILMNKIRNSTGGGIRVTTTDWTNITGNVVESTHGQALLNSSWNEGESNYTYRHKFGAIDAGFDHSTIGSGQYDISNNVLLQGNFTGILIRNAPVQPITVENNQVDDFVFGIIDTRRGAHTLLRNTITNNIEGIRIDPQGNPILLDNAIIGKGKANESKGIAIYGYRPSIPYAISTNNSVEDALIGIFVHLLSPHTSPNQYPVTLQDVDWVRNTTYGVFLSNSTTYLHNVSFEENKFGLYSINSSARVDQWSSFSDNENGSYIYRTNTSWSLLAPYFNRTYMNSNEYSGIIVYQTGGKGVYLEEVETSYNGERGIQSRNSTLEITNSKVWNNSVEGLEIIDSSGSVESTNVSANQYGAYLRLSDMDFKSNEFWNNKYSLYLYKNSVSTVEFNSFDNPQLHETGRHGVSLYECNAQENEIVIQNNTFLATNNSIYSKDSGSSKTIYVKYNNISTNYGGRAIGIYQSQGSVSILENDLWNVTTGMYIESAYVTVEKNTIYLWGWESYPRGIYSSSPTTLIGNNSLDVISKKFGWTEVNGIRGTWRLAYNNTVKGYAYGFRVSSTTNSTMKQNHIEGNSAGVRLWGSGVSPLIENNTFVNNVDGVLVQGGASPTILNNTMNNSGYFTAGVEVSYGTPTIEGNSIQNIGKFGIWVRSQYGNPEILLNTISYNDYGIKIEGGNATIHNNNNIHHNDYGIYLDTSSGPQIDNNTIENNNDYGIYVYNASLTYLNISWNYIENNTDGSGIDYGVYGAVAPSPYWSCKCNWWGNNTGPNDTDPGPPYQNDGDGDRVSNYVDYVNWTRIVGGNRVCDGGPSP